MVKIGAFPNATPTSKSWKNLSVDQNDQRHRSVWVGQADFSKSPKENKNSLNMSTACLFKKIGAQYAFTGKRTKTKRKH